MKIVVIALKVMGIAVLCLLPIPLLIFFMFIPTDTPEIDSRELVHGQPFQHLHQLITQLDTTKNIAVLPQNEYIVIDGIVINLIKRTFGNEPAIGFYQSYYDEGSKHKFSAIDSLLAPRHLDSITVYQITTAMKTSDIADVKINPKAIVYRWKVSAMYGEEGILYSEETSNNDSSHYKLFEKIAPHFYHFAR